MNDSVILSLGKEAIYISFLLSAPTMGLALVLGVVISLLQAVTQIQDMTLTFVPKLIGIGLVLLVSGGWMLTILLDFTNRILLNLASFK